MLCLHSAGKQPLRSRAVTCSGGRRSLSGFNLALVSEFVQRAHSALPAGHSTSPHLPAAGTQTCATTSPAGCRAGTGGPSRWRARSPQDVCLSEVARSSSGCSMGSRQAPPRGSPLQLRRHSPGRPGPWAGASGEGAAGTATAHPLAASLRVAPGGLTWSSGGSSCVPVASSVLFVWPHGTGGAVLSPERVSAGSSWEAAWARDAPRAFTLVPHGADGAELRSRASALQEELSPPTSEVAPARTVPRSSHVPFCSRDGRSVVMFTGLFLFW